MIADLAARGRYTFSALEAARALGGSRVAARAALRRLKEKAEIAAPLRGFYVIVPPEYRSLGCLPPEQLVPDLMAHLKALYYVGLLSAAQFHGAAHQQPQEFQVMTEKNRAPVVCGRVRVVFTARRNANRIPTVLFNTPRGVLRVSTPEATAVDLVAYPGRAGGLDMVASSLAELAEAMDPKRLVIAVKKADDVPAAQRLGYLLERVGATALTEPLARHVRGKATHVVPLVPASSMRGAPRDARWRIALNVEVEAEP